MSVRRNAVQSLILIQANLNKQSIINIAMDQTYVFLERPSQLQKFWLNYLRDDHVLSNAFAGKMHDDRTVVLDNGTKIDIDKHVTFGPDLYIINKKFWDYARTRPRENQKYHKTFVHPETQEVLLLHDPTLEKIKEISNKKFTWFFNSESYTEIQTDHILNELHCIPTGFKSNWILSRSFTKNTKIFYYDINNYMLKFKKNLIEKWDGYDYPKFINEYGFDPKVLPDDHTIETLQDEWRRELVCWGGEDGFARMWNYQKNFEYKFIQLDLYNDFKQIKPSFGRSTCWFSNVFFYPTLFLTWDEQEVWEQFRKFLDHFKSSRVYLRDPFGGISDDGSGIYRDR